MISTKLLAPLLKQRYKAISGYGMYQPKQSKVALNWPRSPRGGAMG